MNYGRQLVCCLKFSFLFSFLAALLMYPFLGGGPPRTIHPVNPDAPLRLPDGVTKKVLVIGGGVAGLTTALKLAERGFDVTIKEKESYIGGRFGTQIFRALGKEFHVSHGFHGMLFSKIELGLFVLYYLILLSFQAEKIWNFSVFLVCVVCASRE